MKMRNYIGGTVKVAIGTALVTGVIHRYGGDRTEAADIPRADAVSIDDILGTARHERAEELTEVMKLRIMAELGRIIPSQELIYSQEGVRITVGARGIGPLVVSACDVADEFGPSKPLELSVLPSLPGDAAKAALLAACATQGFFQEDNTTTEFRVDQDSALCKGGSAMTIALTDKRYDTCKAVVCESNIVVKDVIDVSPASTIVPALLGRCATTGVPEADVCQSL